MRTVTLTGDTALEIFKYDYDTADKIHTIVPIFLYRYAERHSFQLHIPVICDQDDVFYSISF